MMDPSKNAVIGWQEGTENASKWREAGTVYKQVMTGCAL